MNSPAFVRRVLWLVVLAGISPSLGAQDVMIGEVAWAGADPAPEVLPALKGRVRPDYPDELSRTNEVGYVIVRRYLDATGKSLSISAEGTHVPFQRAVEQTFEDWAMRPAQRGGKGVDAEVWIPVIFNPKSAGPKGADATPRLLAVGPVIVPNHPVRGSQSPVVRVHLSLDAGGAVVKAMPEGDVPARALAGIQDGLKKWRFAPARQNGQPVPAEAVVAVLTEHPPRAEEANVVPAKPISQKRPEYPYAMRRFGLRGQVVIEFIVDTAGRVQNPVVVQSDNPAFEEPAIKALRDWKFEPGTRDGKPAELKQRVPIIFQLDNIGGGEIPFTFSDGGDQSKLPPEMRYDTPPRIIGVLLPVYPYALRHDEVRGHAKATMLINQSGHVAAVKVQSADQPEFGLALAAALDGFTFDPALKDGKPVTHLVNFEQMFNGTELPDDAGERLLAVEKKHPEKILGANGLDEPLKPVSRRAPRFPTSIAENVTTGEAMVECLIDEDGRVRLPRVVSATDPAFGYSAVQASATWWFEPPKAGGKPAIVRVRLPFAFNVKRPKPAAAPAEADAKPPG